LLAKEEVANHKFYSLIGLLEVISPENMKFFSYLGEETVGSIFLVIGTALRKRLLKGVKTSIVMIY